ncbi:hypothetical protein ACCAA_560048 [Candidatus Accumulibacter aalborgensis]|uniref:Uncharacterized protein n=1 Tax=Candidatus Accumulibacter aalborgensis TaxID=1860102 RepID=A0A1A8XUF6_9PROT|nr:hypothetical protein ACCAA_560048 [Candidatus Accumulibacter aalborgensis]
MDRGQRRTGLDAGRARVHAKSVSTHCKEQSNGNLELYNHQLGALVCDPQSTCWSAFRICGEDSPLDR